MLTRERISGIIGTAVFAVLLLLVLLFSFLKLTPPPQELEGIPVMFGTMDAAGGFVEPPLAEVIPQPTQPTPTVSQPTVNEPIIAQAAEPTIDVQAQIEEDRRRREQQEADARQRAEEAEARRRAEEEARRQQEEERRSREISQQLSGLFGEAQGSRGETEGEGTQGVSTGSDIQGAPTGTGGVGTVDLGGRTLGAGGLARPRFEVDDFGIVVVNITVNPAGEVIHAEVGRGTTTPNATLRNEAMRAARATRFNAITGTNNQTGTITYNFNLR
jgi:TonB family protein